MEGFGAEVKLSVLHKFIATFVRHGGKFRRVGYYNDTIAFLNNAKTNQSIRNQRVNFCLINMLLTHGPRQSRSFVFVSEVDKEALKKSLRTLDENVSQYYYLGKDGRERNISYDYKGFVGHFFAPKSNIGCQLADLAGHIALKAETANTSYTKAVASIYREFEDAFEFNDIIEMKMSK